MLHILQKKIEEIYRLDGCPEVNEYLLSPKHFKSIPKVSDYPQVLYVDEGNDASLGVYFGKRLFKKIKNKTRVFSFQDFCIITEEICHFVYLRWSESNNKQITLLDLEMQAEIDKYLLATNFFPSNQELVDKLFGQFSLRKNLKIEEKNRYIEATRLGRKLANYWKNRKDTFSKKMSWLRYFYRKNPHYRISMIEAL